MKRDESAFGKFLVLPLVVALSALSIIFLFSVTSASALTPQGKGGTIKPAPTPTPAATKQTPPKRSMPPARASRTNASKTGGNADAAEIAFWNSIKDSRDPEDFRAYLQQYPQGKFAALAKNRVNVLDAPARAEAARKEEAKRKEDEAAATERTYWETIKNSNNPEDFSEYLRKYPNGQFADLAKNRVNALNSSRTTTGNPVSAPKPVAGAWPVPEVKGDSNCLDEPCKIIRRIVAAAPSNFKPITDSIISDEGFFYPKAVPPDFFGPACRIFPERQGLAPTFYHCPYSGQWKADTACRENYEKYLAALGRALPGWFFESQKVYLLDKTWEIAMAGPKECTLQTCPVKLLLYDAKWSDGVLNFEVEAPHDKPEEMLSESFKKQFLEDINAMFVTAASDFRTVSKTEQSIAKHGFKCFDSDAIYPDRHGRSCNIGALPMGRAEGLFELSQQVTSVQKPDWKMEKYNSPLGLVFKAFPPACEGVNVCGVQISWGARSDGFTFSFGIENPPPKKH